MEKKDFVMILGDYRCDKHCPYCIAKMCKSKIEEEKQELELLREKIKKYQIQKDSFQYFILSGNGEPTYYSKEYLQEIKELVESSGIFQDYRIQTSGKLFSEPEKLQLFTNWLKEITVITNNSKKDQAFYLYPKEYLNSKEFLKTSRIRVNIALLKENLSELNSIIEVYSKQKNIETIALKILDRPIINTKESIWIKEHGIAYQEIEKVIEEIKKKNHLLNFKKKRFYFQTPNKKIITLNYDPMNTYDDINIQNNFCWHERKIEKGIYGEFSKIEEELEEAKDALGQQNTLMFLIELSDILGAIEGVIEKHNLTLEDLKKFSNKVKEGKKYERV